MKQYKFHPEADTEYTDAIAYYLGVDPGLSGRFFDEIQSLISDVCRFPQRYRIFDDPVRRHFSQIFPYALIYRDTPERVIIIAVMHMNRRPSYWKSRLSD